MDKYVSRDLQNMICRELEGIAKKKEIDTPATVDILKSLTSSLKNLMKIDKMGMDMEIEDPSMRGYSQRSIGRYYVDGTYGTDRGYDYGNSYRMPRVYPMYMDDGYSRHGDSKEEVVKELHKLMESTSDEHMKKSISEILMKL